MLKIDKYEFEEIDYLRVVLHEIRHERIIGSYWKGAALYAFTCSLDGLMKTCSGRECFSLTPIDKFKDLRRVFEEGAIIHFGGDNTTVSSLKDFDNNAHAFDRFYIKGHISIKSWDENKDLIKEYWGGAKIEDFCYGQWGDAQELSWCYTRDRYRVKPHPLEKYRDIIKMKSGKHCCWVHEAGGYFAYCHADGRPKTRTGNGEHPCRTWSSVGVGVLYKERWYNEC